MALSRCKEIWRRQIVHWYLPLVLSCPLLCAHHRLDALILGGCWAACYTVLLCFFLSLHMTEEWWRQESPVETIRNVYYIGEWDKEKVYELQWQVANPLQSFSIQRPQGLPKLSSSLKQLLIDFLSLLGSCVFHTLVAWRTKGGSQFTGLMSRSPTIHYFCVFHCCLEQLGFSLTCVLYISFARVSLLFNKEFVRRHLLHLLQEGI